MAEPAIILRSSAFGDQSRIVRCFTESMGSIMCFYRVPKRTARMALVQTGGFAALQLHPQGDRMMRLQGVDPHPFMPRFPLVPERLATWLFTIELLNKTLQDHFPLPELFGGLMRYYSGLHDESLSNHPLTPLVVIATALGLMDTEELHIHEDHPVLADMLGLHIDIGLSHRMEHPDELFDRELNRVLTHFSVKNMETRALLCV